MASDVLVRPKCASSIFIIVLPLSHVDFELSPRSPKAVLSCKRWITPRFFFSKMAVFLYKCPCGRIGVDFFSLLLLKTVF